MAYDYSEVATKTQQLAQQMLEQHWLFAAELHGLLAESIDLPDVLLPQSEGDRPLMVAFLGGTGVGKSTLLNRLAGKEVAKTGVVRPTSKEVSLFHHQSVDIRQLPSSFPLEKIRVSAHEDVENKSIVWIDMPDFDSTEKNNQRLVLDWLPHIDVLIYVVSPERYRDNKAWQLLLSEGGKHAWVFVLNQSDRAQIEQYQDFSQQLIQTGFENPLIYQTCCEVAAGGLDEFADLQKMMQTLATEKTVLQLAEHGDSVRKVVLAREIRKVKQALGQPENLENLKPVWHKQWQALELYLMDFMGLTIQEKSRLFAENSALAVEKDKSVLWNHWSQSRLSDTVDNFMLQLDRFSLPIAPLRQPLELLKQSAEATIEAQVLLSVHQSLINPGNRIQRAALKIAALAEVLLPLLVMGWVGYHAFKSFYLAGLADNPQYVGIDFCVNAVILVLVSWGVPYFVQKKLSPSLEKAAQNGLTTGLVKGLKIVEQQALEQIDVYQASYQRLQLSLDERLLSCQIEHQGEIETMPVELRRMLLDVEKIPLKKEGKSTVKNGLLNDFNLDWRGRTL